MDYRSHVYSPLQNMTVWLAAWLHGHVSTDECADALTELGGVHRMAGTHPELEFTTLEFLKTIRGLAQDFLLLTEQPEPVVRIIVAGPGDPARLPAESEAAAMLRSEGLGALVVQEATAHHTTVLVPRLDPTGYQWHQFKFVEPLPAPAYLSPGEADYYLAEATRQAAMLIETNFPDGSIKGRELPDPRLTVGTLGDFYDTPGLPFCTPPRAARLFARADRVSAIVETIQARVGDHSFDPQLIPLWRHIRIARMAGVSYAVSEFGRLS